MNTKVLFLVDHKHRDLPSLSLIGYHLQARGFTPGFVGVGDEFAMVETFDPGFVVLPKPVYDYERLIRWKRDGRRLIVCTSSNQSGPLSLFRKRDFLPVHGPARCA